MSIIGRKIKFEYPIDNSKTQTGEGIVVDKFSNSFVNQSGQVMIYDTYLVKGAEGKLDSVHPTLLTEIVE